MLGIEEIGLVVVVWGVSAIIFRDWVVRFDLAMRERVTGEVTTDAVVDQQRDLLERTARGMLAAGLMVFAIGAAMHFTGMTR